MDCVDSRLEAAFELAGSQIRRQLSECFDQLDARTGSVVMRKELHALFVQEAILMAQRRFPCNGTLKEAIEAAQVGVARAEPALAERVSVAGLMNAKPRAEKGDEPSWTI